MSDNESMRTAMWLAVMCVQFYTAAHVLELSGGPTIWEMTNPDAQGAAVMAGLAAVGVAVTTYWSLTDDE